MARAQRPRAANDDVSGNRSSKKDESALQLTHYYAMTPPFAEAAGAPVKRRRVSAAPPPVVTIDYALHYAELKPRASKPPPPPLPRPPAASHNDFRALFSTVEREFAYTHVYRKFLTTVRFRAVPTC